MKRFIAIIVLTIFTSVFNVSASTNLYDGFEKKINSSMWDREMANDKYSGTISTKYKKTGKSSLRVEVRKTDPDVSGSKRSELAMNKAESPNEEHTYSVDILLPNQGDEKYLIDTDSTESIWQWHNVPDFDKGEGWTSPPLSLQTENGRYLICSIWDDNEVSNPSTMWDEGKQKYYDLGEYKKDLGKWVSWKVHVKWGWLKSQKPKLEVYKNGKKVLDLNGKPNMTNDEAGVYMKLGIYKWDWKKNPTPSSLNKRIIYYDNVKID